MRVKSHVNPWEIQYYSRRTDNKIKLINEKYIVYQFSNCHECTVLLSQ